MAVQGKKGNSQFSSSTISIGSDEDEVYCQACDQDGRHRLPAHGYCTNCSEHLCETCFTLHRRHKLSRHHTLLDKSSMPQRMPYVTTSHSDNLQKQCPKHSLEMIKFYCHDHKALLCSVCVTLEHTPVSCNVHYIPDVSGQVINSKEYQDTLKVINDMTIEANKTLMDMRKMNDKSNRSLTKALTHIKAFRTKINQKIDELEKQVKEAANVLQKENCTKQTRVEKECEDVLKSLKISSDTITYFNTSKQANNLFMEIKQAEKKIKDYEQSIANLTALDVKGYNFEPNEAISNLLSKEKSMGTLKGRPITLNLMPRKCTNKDEICIKTEHEKCLITGMTLLTPNLLIITDYYNNAVKLVDISNKSVLDQHKLDSTPWDITSISHNEIAVTILDKHNIQFMSVSSNNLKKKHTVKVNGQCKGIRCHKDKMVVTFINPAKLQILHINGTVLQTIQDKNIFSWPYYVTTSNNYIYVSDYDKSTIIKLNWQGEVKDKYDCQPRGLIMSDDSNVFFCWYDDNTIREISEDFTKEQTVIEDIQDPRAICWSAETNTLYISSYTVSPENDKIIKVYKFSK